MDPDLKAQADRLRGIPVIFRSHMKPGVVSIDPLFARPGAPVFICRSAADLLAAIDREFWREMGIADPRLEDVKKAPRSSGPFQSFDPT